MSNELRIRVHMLFGSINIQTRYVPAGRGRWLCQCRVHRTGRDYRGRHYTTTSLWETVSSIEGPESLDLNHEGCRG